MGLLLGFYLGFSLSLWGHSILEPNHQAVREPKLAHVM